MVHLAELAKVQLKRFFCLFVQQGLQVHEEFHRDIERDSGFKICSEILEISL